MGVNKLPIYVIPDELEEYERELNQKPNGFRCKFVIDNETLIINIQEGNTIKPFIYNIVYTDSIPYINQNNKVINNEPAYEFFLSTFDTINRILYNEYLKNDM